MRRLLGPHLFRVCSPLWPVAATQPHVPYMCRRLQGGSRVRACWSTHLAVGARWFRIKNAERLNRLNRPLPSVPGAGDAAAQCGPAVQGGVLRRAACHVALLRPQDNVPRRKKRDEPQPRQVRPSRPHTAHYPRPYPRPYPNTILALPRPYPRPYPRPCPRPCPRPYPDPPILSRPLPIRLLLTPALASASLSSTYSTLLYSTGLYRPRPIPTQLPTPTPP